MPILSEHVQGENQNIVQKMRSVKQNLAMKGFKKSSYLGVLVVLALVVTTVALGPRALERQKFERSQAAAPDVVIKPEVTQKVAAQGKTRVMVSLNTSKVPSGAPNSSEVVAQKNQIKSYQDQLTAALAGLQYRVINKYENLPYINIEVNQAVLTKLQTLKGVVITVSDDVDGEAQLYDTSNIVGETSLMQNLPPYDGTNSIVVIIDSGVDSTHPMLQGKVIDEVCFGECPNGNRGVGVAAPCDWSANCDHGTKVAGAAAGRRIDNPDFDADGQPNAPFISGVAPGASIIAIRTASKACDASGVCTPDTLIHKNGDFLAAVDWVISNSRNYAGKFIASVNMSIKFGDELYTSYCDDRWPELRDAFALLRASKIAPVVSSGNQSLTNSLVYPACISSAVPVGNATKQDVVSATSNVASVGVFPNLLMAPGTDLALPDILSNPTLRGGYEIATGTSFSAPIVAGGIAVLEQVSPFSDVDYYIGRIKDSAVYIRDQRTGALDQTLPRIQIDGAALGTTTVAAKALTFDYPVKSGNNRVLVVSAAYQHGSVADLNNTRLTGVTYGGAAMQPLFAISPTNPRANVSSFTDPSGVARNTEIWYLVNPPVGTQQINATFGADPGEKNLMATTLFDVDFTSPFGVVGKTSAAGTTLDPTRIGFPANGYGGSLANADLPGCDTTAKCKLLSVFATDLSNGTNPAKAAAAADTFTKQPVVGLFSKQTYNTAVAETGKLGVLLATSDGIDKVTSSGDAIQTMLRTPKRLGFSSVGFFWKELKTASSPTPTPTPSPTPSPTLTTRGTPQPPIRGWTASYYPNTTFTGGSNSLSNLIGTVGGVNFDWGSGNPVGKYGFNFSLTFPSDNFSANFSGRISPTVSGTYNFKTDADNTAVFTITNGSGVETTVINGGGVRTASYAMTAGQTYTLNVKYTELTGNAKVKLFWKTPGTTTFVPIPAESMAPVDNSWMLLLSSGTYSIVGLPPQNSCEHTVRFVNKPNDGIQNVMDADAVVENYVVIEENSPRLNRDTAATWTQTCGGTASGDCLYFTRNSGLGFEFKTKAQKITYLGRRGDKQGSMQVYVDGVLRGTYNRYATSYIGQQPIDVSLTNLTCPTTSTPTPAPTSVSTPPPTGSTPPPVVGGSNLVAIADSTVRSTEASANFGTRTTLDVGGSPVNLSYFKFNLAGLTGSSISSAKLRVRVNNGSTSTQSIKQVNDTSWSETGITYNNRPAVGTVVGTNNGGVVGEWKEADITTYVKSKAGSTISLAMDQTGGDGFAMYSRESTDKPVIVINSSGATLPPPPPPPPPGAPVINLTANGSGGPITVAANSSVTLTWSTSNATSCSSSASVATTNWSGSKGISGAQAVAIATSRTLTLTCTGSGGTTSDSVVINVTSTSSTPTPAPTSQFEVMFKNIPDSNTTNDLFLLNSVNFGGTTYQESSSIFTYSGSWTTTSTSKYTVNTAQVTFKTNATSLTLLTSRGPTRASRVEVYVNGVLKQVLNLNNSTTLDYSVLIPLN